MNATILKTSTIKPTTTVMKILSTVPKVLKKAENVANIAEFSKNERVTNYQQTLRAKDASGDELQECAEGFIALCEKVQPEWWAYMILAVFVFLVLLLLNFIVKKINDARMEERCARLYTKSATCTQVQTRLIKGDYDSKKKVHATKSTTSALTGVSLIFSKSDNDRVSTNTTTSTSLRIADCGEAFQNARSIIDSIYEESEDTHIIHRHTNTVDVIQNNDNMKDGNDIKETLASGDTNANAVAVGITTDKENFVTTIDSDGNTKSKAYFEFEVIRRRFEVIGKKRPIFLKKQFKTNSITNTKNDKNMVNSKNICLKNSNDDIVIINGEDITENHIEINNEDPREEINVVNVENTIILNGSNFRSSETKVDAIKEVKNKVHLRETKDNIEVTKKGSEFEKKENNN